MSRAVETTSPRFGEAGHWGSEVRSDAHVAFQARDSGGVEISLESRVAAYYGSAILEQTREVLGELGVKHARVAIHDEGALPFVIAARIEAAAERAGIALGKHSLPEQHPLPGPSPKDRLRRSRLYQILQRSLKSGLIAHCLGVEDCNIRRHAGPEQAAIHKAGDLGRE